MTLRLTLLLAVVAAPLAAAADTLPDANTTTLYRAHPWDETGNIPQESQGRLEGRADVDESDRLVVVHDQTARQAFIVGHTRFVDVDGKPLPRDALHEGDQVQVDYDRIGNTTIARQVKILGHLGVPPP